MSLEVRINGATDCSRCEWPVEVLHVDVPLVHRQDGITHVRLANRCRPCGCVTRIYVAEIAADERRAA